VDFLQPLVVVVGQLCIIELPDGLCSFFQKGEKRWAEQSGGIQTW